MVSSARTRAAVSPPRAATGRASPRIGSCSRGPRSARRRPGQFLVDRHRDPFHALSLSVVLAASADRTCLHRQRSLQPAFSQQCLVRENIPRRCRRPSTAPASSTMVRGQRSSTMSRSWLVKISCVTELARAAPSVAGARAGRARPWARPSPGCPAPSRARRRSRRASSRRPTAGTGAWRARARPRHAPAPREPDASTSPPASPGSAGRTRRRRRPSA